MIFDWQKPLPVDVEILSVCCGAPWNSELWSICGFCRDHTGFVAYDADGNELGEVNPSDFHFPVEPRDRLSNHYGFEAIV